MNIAILGSQGNVGRLATEFFNQQGDHVTAYGSKEPTFDLPQVANQEIDYFNQKHMKAVWQSHDVVIILNAFKYSAKEWARKWPTFAHLCSAAVQDSIAKTIFFDNVYPYGLVIGEMKETSGLNPASKKGEIRKEVDEVFLNLIEKGKDVIIARSADFYGPQVQTSLMGQRFHDQLNKGIFEWMGKPEKFHSFTFLPDIPPALFGLAHSDKKGVYHLPTSSENMSGSVIKSTLEELNGKTYKTSSFSKLQTKLIGIFMPILGELSEMMYQFENDYRFNSDKIKQEFPNLKTTPLKEGLRTQFESYKQI